LDNKSSIMHGLGIIVASLLMVKLDLENHTL